MTKFLIFATFIKTCWKCIGILFHYHIGIICEDFCPISDLEPCLDSKSHTNCITYCNFSGVSFELLLEHVKFCSFPYKVHVVSQLQYLWATFYELTRHTARHNAHFSLIRLCQMQPLARSGTSIETNFDTPESRSLVVGFLVAILMIMIYFIQTSSLNFENISWSPSKMKGYHPNYNYRCRKIEW